MQRQLSANTFAQYMNYSCAWEEKQGADFIPTVFRGGEKYFVNILASSRLSVRPFH